jgi:hypothetical protein
MSGVRIPYPPPFLKDIYKKAHESSFKNKESILSSNQCGCFFCCSKFAPEEITEWADKGLTALCPSCTVDSVLCENDEFAITEDFLLEMREVYWNS